jgi:RHS repeat-associated protein
MENGALVRKHAIDSALLCCLLCIAFFAANPSYPDVVDGIENPGYWEAFSALYIYSNGIDARAQTFVWNTAYGLYNKSYVNGTLTKADGSQDAKSNCGFPYGSVGGGSWWLPLNSGTYHLESDHYVGWNNCTGTYLGHTSVTLNFSQVSINYFYSNPTSAPPNGTSTLYWSTANGTSISINGTSVSATGSMAVNPAASTLYTLTVSNNDTSAQAKATVRKNEPLTPHFYKYSVRHEKGISPFFPYAQVEQESVNSANGNLHFTVPLLSRPGRNGLGVNLALAYNSKIWDFFVQGSTLYATLPEYDSWVGLGWTLSMGRIIDDSANGYYYVTSSDGSNHTLKYYGGAWRSTDSTYMVYDPASYKLTLKGGLNLQFGYQDVIRPYIRYATKIQDTNGNYLDIAYSGSGGTISSIQDTLGNTYTFLLNSNGRLQYIRYCNTNDTTQATGTISLDYLSLSPSFGSGATTDQMLLSQQMLYHINYLTGVRHTFDYYPSGELYSITYPTLGMSRYYYSTYTVLDRSMGRTVPDHYVTSHNTGPNAYMRNWSINPNGNTAPTTVQITMTGIVDTFHYMQKSSTGWADGFVTKTKQADNLSKEASQDWIQDDEQLSTIFNPRVSWIKGMTAQTVSPYASKSVRKEFSYAPYTDYSGNVKEIREYAFNEGALRRKTAIDYLHESNGSYASLNILDRVTSSLVYDGSNNVVSKTETDYDVLTLYDAPNAIRHNTAFGTSYLLRGLPTSVKRWHNIAQNQYIVSSSRYDECGNPREIINPRSYMTYMEYSRSANDNAYAFPLLIANAKMQASESTYSYKSGVALTSTDTNGKVTTMTYDSYDRVIQVTKPDDARKTFTYVESPSYQFSPYVIVRQYVVGDTYVEQRMDLNNMGRLKEETALGNIKQDQTYNIAGAVKDSSIPHISGQTAYRISYSTGGVYQQSVNFPDSQSITYYNGPDWVKMQRNDGPQRVYYYQEDGKVRQVMEQDPITGELNVGTDYVYDALGRLTLISQGVQTRSFTYDSLGRLLTETLPETGTTSYIYDENSNVISRTDSRGVTTTNTYDELDRITYRSYTDGTPAVSYFYDSQPGDSPITILNPVGRLTKVQTTASGVTVSSFYSYCNCSSVNLEATVINNGTAKTYITSYSYNLAGQLTSMTYPSGKVVNYTRDTQGRETKVSSTYNGQPFDYIYGALYEGPQGALTKITYPIYNGSSRVTTQFTYEPNSLLLTHMQDDYVANYDYSYVDAASNKTSLIQDIANLRDANSNQHFQYDKWDRLAAYWTSNQRAGTPSRKVEFSYDRYGNITGVAETIGGQMQTYSFNVDPVTNRLLSRTRSGGTTIFSYDNAGNMTSMGTFDAENRLTSRNGTMYLYDGNGRRFRKQGAAVVNYVYSFSGQLLVEDNVTASTTDSMIYFNGQVVAIQGQQESSFKLFLKDRLGSTVQTYIVALPNYDKTISEWSGYDVWGSGSTTQYNPPYTDIKYQGKKRENDLDYFGARYYDSLGISSGSSLRWISADPITSRIYNPQSLNKYTYVSNDPVNRVDGDGRQDGTIRVTSSAPGPWWDQIPEPPSILQWYGEMYAYWWYSYMWGMGSSLSPMTDWLSQLPTAPGGGSSGAGGTSQSTSISALSPEQQKIAENAQTKAIDLMNDSWECNQFVTKLLDGVNQFMGSTLSVSSLVDVVQNLHFQNGIFIQRPPRGGENVAPILAITEPGGQIVTLNKPFYDDKNQASVLIHESFHGLNTMWLQDEALAGFAGWTPNTETTMRRKINPSQYLYAAFSKNCH